MNGTETHPDPLGDTSVFVFGEFQTSQESPQRRTSLLWLRYLLIAASGLVGAALSWSVDTQQATGLALGVCAASYAAAALDGLAFNKATPKARFATAPKIVRMVCFAASVVAAWQLATLMALP